MKMNKKNLIKGMTGIIITSSIIFTLTGCGNDGNNVKEYEKEESSIGEVENKTLEGNNNVEEENNQKNESNEKTQNKELNRPKVGIYTTEDAKQGYYRIVNILVQNVESNYIDFSINAACGSSEDRVNVGNVNGKAEKKSDGVYVFTETIEGETSEITFTFNSNNTVTIKEDYPSDRNPYGGDRVFFAGEHEYTGKTETNITDEYSNIYLTSEEVKKEDFIDMWSNERDATKLAINKDGTFVIDHFTSSSEVTGKYTISGTKIYFTNSDGIKWEGEVLMQQAGNHTLKINYENKDTYLYNDNGDGE